MTVFYLNNACYPPLADDIYVGTRNYDCIYFDMNLEKTMKNKPFHILMIAGVTATLFGYSLMGIQTNRANADAATTTATPINATPAAEASIVPCILATQDAATPAVSTPNPIPVIEYALPSEAPHEFVYAGVKFTIMKAMISNHNKAGVTSEHSGFIDLAFSAVNATPYQARLDDAVLTIQLRDCQTFQLPLGNIQSNDTAILKLNMPVSHLIDWNNASLTVLQPDKEPLALSLNAGPILSQYPITLMPENAADGINNNGASFTFKVKQASLNVDGATESADVRADLDMRFIKLTVNITYVAGGAPALVSADDFRLYADDTPYNRVFETEATALDVKSNYDLTLWFLVPVGAKTLILNALPDGTQPVKITLTQP